MSQVISFRLDRTNPRESQALAILEAHQERGFRLRHIMVEALLCLDAGHDETLLALMSELQAVLEETRLMLTDVQNGRWSNSSELDSRDALQAELSESFLASVRDVAKPGLRAK